MELKKAVLLAVLVAAIGTLSYCMTRYDTPPTNRMGPTTESHTEVSETAALSVVTAYKPSQREVRRALVKSVLESRDPCPEAQRTDPEYIEMTWEQYKGWTKFAAALAIRDYKNVERMVPAMHNLFGPTVTDAMVDVLIQDYTQFLREVADSHCEGFDVQSVWRKTMFMTFALARLDRSSASIDQLTEKAHSDCGY